MTLGQFALAWRRGRDCLWAWVEWGPLSSLPGIIDRSAMRFELWESPEAEAEAGLITAQQRERSVRFDAIGVGRRGRWLTGRDDLQRGSRP